MFLFLVLINAAGFQNRKCWKKPFNKRLPMPRIYLKYVNDMTVTEALNLKLILVANPDHKPPRPLQYHQRTGTT